MNGLQIAGIVIVTVLCASVIITGIVFACLRIFGRKSFDKTANSAPASAYETNDVESAFQATSPTTTTLELPVLVMSKPL